MVDELLRRIADAGTTVLMVEQNVKPADRGYVAARRPGEPAARRKLLARSSVIPRGLGARKATRESLLLRQAVPWCDFF